MPTQNQVRIPLSILSLLLLMSLAHGTLAAPPPATPEQDVTSNGVHHPVTPLSDPVSGLSTTLGLSSEARLNRSSFRGEGHAPVPNGAASGDAADFSNLDLLRLSRSKMLPLDDNPAVQSGGLSSATSRNLDPLRLQTTWRTLYANDFSDPDDNGWFTDEDDTLKHAYVDGEYQILIKTDTHFSVVRGGPRLTDAGVEVQARFATDNLGTYGLGFGITDDWSAYYTFQIDGESNYEIWRRDAEGWTLLSGPTHSEHINAGQTANQLRLERQGDRVSFYANGQSLTTVQIPDVAGRRHMGVVASARGTLNVDARFDNFEIFVPESLAREDDFTDPESGWCELVDETREMGYADGEYRILLKEEGQSTWCVRTEPSLADFDVEVQARYEGEQLDKSYGLILRFQDHDNFYYFGVGPVFGTYSLRKQEAGTWTSLVDWTASPAINQGETPNRLRAVGIGSEIWLFVNDQFLTSVTDDTFSEGGHGLLAANSADPDGAEIFFDDFAAYSVGGSSAHRIYLPLIGRN